MSGPVDRWVARRLVQPPLPDHFTVRHANSETGESQRVHRLPIRAGDPGAVAKEIASDAYDVARDHALAWPGRPQLYRIGAVAKGKIDDWFPFRVRAEGRMRSDPLAEGSEPPTPGGLLAQHMRFTESAMRIALESSAESIDSLRRENADLRAAIARDSDRRLKFMETFETLMDRAAERQLDLKRHEADSARRDLMANTVIKELLPAASKALPGVLGQVLGGGKNNEGQVLEKLWRVLSSLPDEARGQLLRALPAEARADLESLVDAVSQESQDQGRQK